MGATRDDFIKYRRTPHLFGSKGTDDDKHLGRKESEAFITDPSLIVEEKLDGTNIGIHFTSRGRMVLQCREHTTCSCLDVSVGQSKSFLNNDWTIQHRWQIGVSQVRRHLQRGKWINKIFRLITIPSQVK